MNRESRFLHSVRDSHGLEVSTVVNFPGFAIDQGIIGGYTRNQKFGL